MATHQSLSSFSQLDEIIINNSGGNGEHGPAVFGRLIQDSAQVADQVRLDSESRSFSRNKLAGHILVLLFQ